MRGQENSIGIYVRESRDDNGEKYETIETQRDLLIDFAGRNALGRIHAVYIDDNVSGSAFDRDGLSRLREDVVSCRINMLLIKDLSRLGRNNAKTLQFLDFLEEYGVRVLSCDGRYDSLRDGDMAGIESWLNERYVRDISRKIRSSLHFKIQRGEYVGNAPFGYKKSGEVKNRLCIDDSEAETVRLIYRFYRSGLGYSVIASELDRRRCPPPGGRKWNRMAVRRILCSRVYIGDTVQGVSEKISFKSKKTRRLPQEQWVITKGTHDAIITEEEFNEAQNIRKRKTAGIPVQKGFQHPLSCLVRCGGCGSVMYARKRTGGTAYVCGNYFRNGRKACTSHFIYGDILLKYIGKEMKTLFLKDPCPDKLLERLKESFISDLCGGGGAARARKQLATYRRRQELLYADRLDGRISGQLFDRVNSDIEDRIKAVENRLAGMDRRVPDRKVLSAFIEEAGRMADRGELSNEIVRLLVSGITVYDPGDSLPAGLIKEDERPPGKAGYVVIDFRMGINV